MNPIYSNGHLIPIFLFSLPRSGSTFSQRIIGSHPDVATANEPHFLIPLFYALKEKDVRSTYNHYYSAQAIQDFCDYLPHGVDDYYEELHALTLHLYSKAASHKARYFLDKTPKYHLIPEDIIHIFPEAKLIYLWRNPLAIIASMIETWGGGEWNIYHFKIDLFQGLDNLVSSYEKHAGQAYAFHYEDALLNPVETWRKVFTFLNLPFDPAVLTKFSQVHLTGRVTDPNSSMAEFQMINQLPLEKWKRVLNTPMRVSWCQNYLKWIGQERLSIMGYDLETLLAELHALHLTLHHLGKDFYRIPLGQAYHALELQLMKQKYLDWKQGQRIYMHT